MIKNKLTREDRLAAALRDNLRKRKARDAGLDAQINFIEAVDSKHLSRHEPAPPSPHVEVPQE